jgi:hypothetical protein
VMINDAARAVHQEHAQIPVPGLADAEQLRLAPGRVLARDEAEVGSELPPVLEPLRL